MMQLLSLQLHFQLVGYRTSEICVINDILELGLQYRSLRITFLLVSMGFLQSAEESLHLLAFMSQVKTGYCCYEFMASELSF